MRQDYILTARAKGLAERIVIYKHALRNALIPIVTVISLDLGYTLGGTVVIEAVFSRPGLGSLIIQSIYSRDYPQLQGAIMFFALCFLLVNLLTDLVYKFVDPRIEYKGIA
jgi:ABC-type dipeptide/oligopeptide/nickel transport system permease component